MWLKHVTSRHGSLVGSKPFYANTFVDTDTHQSWAVMSHLSPRNGRVALTRVTFLLNHPPEMDRSLVRYQEAPNCHNISNFVWLTSRKARQQGGKAGCVQDCSFKEIVKKTWKGPIVRTGDIVKKTAGTPWSHAPLRGPTGRTILARSAGQPYRSRLIHTS